MAHFRTYLISLLAVSTLISCDPDPMEPETGCNPVDQYSIGYKAVDATKVYDIRTTPPTEIKNGTLEYDLLYQTSAHWNDPHPPAPFSRYFMDSIVFESQESMQVFYRRDSPRMYTYTRDDCSVSAFDAEDTLHFELLEKGAEIFQKRCAIYSHKLIPPSFDSFIFLEFRDASFMSEEQIIQEFALDHQGDYDTIAVEIVMNATRE